MSAVALSPTAVSAARATACSRPTLSAVSPGTVVTRRSCSGVGNAATDSPMPTMPSRFARRCSDRACGSCQ